ncbi:MAG: flagellar protein FlgN [Bacteriovoracaceae bacterium]
MDTSTQARTLYYQQAVTIWEGFCRLHKELYDLTNDEYITLLASDIEKLETMLPLKEEIVSRIGQLEKDRAHLIHKLNESNLFATEITRAGELLEAFADIDQKSGIPALRNLNSLLIDIISKIQEQNKKNQIFLNKAMHSIRELKAGFSGKKTYTTYGADGMTRQAGR